MPIDHRINSKPCNLVLCQRRFGHGEGLGVDARDTRSVEVLLGDISQLVTIGKDEALDRKTEFGGQLGEWIEGC